MNSANRFLSPFTGEVARTKCATMGAAPIQSRIPLSARFGFRIRHMTIVRCQRVSCNGAGE